MGPVLALASALIAGSACAQGRLNVLCTVSIGWCEATAAAFRRETGIEVGVQTRSAADAMAQISSERGNTRTDVWFTGPGEAHLLAAETGMTEEYRSPRLDELHDWAVRLAEQSRYHTVGVYASAVGIAYNRDVLAKKKLAPPSCWSDLAKPEYRDEMQIANPASSPASYTMIATLIQIFGEDRAFDYLRAIHRNTRVYPRFSSGAVRAAARGETAIVVVLLHEAVTEFVNGFPIVSVLPCEGTGFDVGSMSIVKGARNLDNAKKFYDWALTPAAQKIGADMKNYQAPSNKSTPLVAGAPELGPFKLINYDFAKFGGAAERRRVLDKWEREVYSLPR
jgi:iron(III) transport system substrate-binding protein